MNKVLITGATGFVGCRLAEIAVERGVSVVALVRTWSRAARLSRLPIVMVQGDMLNLDSLRRAMEGCDVVFHCAVDSHATGDAHRHSTAHGAENVMQAALLMGVKRVVHLSSVAVYGYRLGRDAATEEGSYRHSVDAYCDGKIAAEKIALRYADRGLAVTVLRPTIVYGPFGMWTTRTVAAIREGSTVLVNGGTGVCNSLFVDNLIGAMLLAAERDGVVGEIFHISDASPVSWKEFIEAHARVLGSSYLPLPVMSVEEIAAAKGARNRRPSSIRQAIRVLHDPRVRKALRSIPAVDQSVRVARRLLPKRARHILGARLLSGNGSGSEDGSREGQTRYLPSRNEIDIVTSNVVVSIEKARRLLGYEPEFNFNEGMEITGSWINWAQL